MQYTMNIKAPQARSPIAPETPFSVDAMVQALLEGNGKRYLSQVDDFITH